MKKGIVLVALLFLTGCAGENQALERGMALRGNLQKAASCTFEAEITADYGEQIHSFSMECGADSGGNLTFTVTAPESIAGITGEINGTGGKLTFDDVALHFELLADGQTSPVSAPWIVVDTLLGGYLTSAGEEDGVLRLSIDDSYQDKALTVDVWLDQQDIPERAEIVYDGKRILTVIIKNFTTL